MISERENTNYRVKVFVRADPELGCERQKQAVVDQLETLDANGEIASYEVDIWAKAIRTRGPLEGTAYYQRVFDHIEAFQQWADDESVQLNSAFNIESVDCEITGETYRVLSLPSICIAVYEDDDLCAVYPHSTDETVQTASSCLKELDAFTQPSYADIYDTHPDGRL